jgi:hypothetical protein
MFNKLNKVAQRGKRPPMVCKILDGLSEVSRRLRTVFEACRYLIEGRQLRNAVFGEAGTRIAFLFRQPVLIRIRSRKD